MSGLLSRFKTWSQKQPDAEPAVEGEVDEIWSGNDMTATNGNTVADHTPPAHSSEATNTANGATPAEAGNDDRITLSPIEISLLQGEIIEQLRTIYDPEIPVNIYELGLIYDVDVTPLGAVDIKMTLTSPGCPVAGTLPPEVRDKTACVPGVTEARVDVIWDPPWNMDMMSDEAKLELGLF
jgi:FeS assembly SUF system protein